jgi:WD40 repeat protein
MRYLTLVVWAALTAGELGAAPVPPRAPTNVKLATAEKGVDWINALECSPDGRWVVTVGMKYRGAYRVEVWDATTGQHAHTFSEPGPKPAFRDDVAAAFSPDGQTLAVAFDTRRETDVVTLCSVGTWKTRATLPHPGAHLRFSADSTLLVSSNSLGSKVWNATTGKLVREFTPPERGTGGDWIYPPVFSPDSKTFAAPTSSGAVNVFEATGQPRFQLPKLEKNSGRNGFVFAPDSKTFAMRTPSDEVRVFETATGKQRLEIPPDGENRTNRVLFSPDGTKLLVSTFRHERLDERTHTFNTVRLLDATTGTVVRTLDFAVEGLGHLAFSPNGKWVAGSAGLNAWVWDVHTGKKVTLFTRPEITFHYAHYVQVETISFSPDGAVVAVCANEERGEKKVPGIGQLPEHARAVSVLYDLRTGREVQLPDVKRVVFSRSGTVALVAGLPYAYFAAPKNERDQVTIRDLAELLKNGRP